MATVNGLSFPELPRASSTLDNGLRVRFVPLPHLQTATVSCFLKVGSRYESSATNGLSHFLEHMVYRGTAAHPAAHELSLAIERLGGTLDATTHVDYTSYDLTLPSETIAEGVSLLAEVMSSPLLTELGTEKQIIREEILEDLNEHGEQVDVDNVSRRLLYRDHPLGFSIAGPIENLERFDTNDLERHHRSFYVASNSVLCVAGAFDDRAMPDIAHDTFGRLPSSGPVPAPAPIDRYGVERFVYVHEPGSQTEVRLSFHTAGVHHRLAPVFMLMSRILDDGLSTRVHRVICEERGLAYDAFAGHDTLEDCGVFDFGATVAHEKAPALVEAMLGIIDDLQTLGPRDEEVEKAKKRYLWDLRSVRDDPEDTVDFVGTSALFGLPEDLSSVARQVAEVSSDDVRRVACDYFEPSRGYLTCVGMLGDQLQLALRRSIGA